jgi:D-hexose-6-phosphate mutarotase
MEDPPTGRDNPRPPGIGGAPAATNAADPARADADAHEHAAHLDAQFGATLRAAAGAGAPPLRFRTGPEGLLFADIDTPLASASICLQGAQVTAWQPRVHHTPVIWMPQAPRYAAGKATRGGIPVCWPWFGAAAPAAGLPSHGFARTHRWHVRAARCPAAGEVELTLELRDEAATRALWPHAFALELHVHVGAALGLALVTRNTAAAPWLLGEALHAYFRVGDIGAVRVEGLQDRAFFDNIDGTHHEGRPGTLSFAGEFDRVYDDQGPECTIVDPVLRRRIRIAKAGSASTVVWNPWSDKAARLGDLGAGSAGQGGWREMLCVESGNTLARTLCLAPGAEHRLEVRYRVEPI